MFQLATICYVDNGKEWLLLHRNKRVEDVHYGKWIGVGGKFEPGETPEECAKREIYEETGLIAEQLSLCGMVTFPEFTTNKDWYTYIFKVTQFSGELLETCSEGTLEWVPYNQILSKPTWEGDYIFLKWVLDNQPFFSAKFTYQQKQLQQHEVTFYNNKL